MLYLPPQEVAKLADSLPPSDRKALLEAASLTGPDRRRALQRAGLQVLDPAIPLGR